MSEAIRKEKVPVQPLAGDTTPPGGSVIVLGSSVDLAVVTVLGVVVIALRALHVHDFISIENIE
jgi:hypothetical protein